MTLKMSFRSGLAVALTAFAGVVLAPGEASACGGFFCSRSPVDQTAEHIIFTINGDHTVTAYVQIKYAGDKDDFAWIIPAPGIPRLSSDLPDLAMRALDVATEPQYFKSSCNTYPVPGFTGAGGSTASAGSPPSSPGVTVLAQQAVGPFQTVTLEGTSADVLVTWLNDNGYRITDKMKPLIQPYVESGMHFVAMKLLADKSTTDIEPIGMTYDSDQPLIPLRLTSVAAQPEMGIVTFILADRRWAPQNFIELQIQDSQIEFDQYGAANNYLTLVSSESDKVGGQAFVTEYANRTTDLVSQIQSQPVNPGVADAQTSRDALVALLTAHPYITRLYARMSAEEMTDDPVFMVSSKTTNVSNMHDLTPVDFDASKCTYGSPPSPPPPCTFAYCGRRGSCVDVSVPSPYTTDPTVTNPAAGCVCANDATARLTTTGASAGAVYCEPVGQDLEDAATNSVQLAAACEGYDCGAHGACVSMNGNPTCQCEAGYAASVKVTYDSTTYLTASSVSCLPSPVAAPALPILPPVGQTTLPRGTGGVSAGTGGAGAGNTPSGNPAETGGSAANGASGSANGEPKSAAAASSSSGGCNVAGAPTEDGLTAMLVGIMAVAAAKRRRSSDKTSFS